MSSAKSLTLDLTWSGRSFIYARKSMGPRTVPCGTPEDTAILSDLTPFKNSLRAYRIGRSLSAVCMYVCMYVVNIFKHLLLRNHWDNHRSICGMGKKICSTGPGHMTKMADMAIYGKNLKKSSSLAPEGR